jgi:hypothetical protein
MAELGDNVQRALTAVGVTEERVQAWAGGPCGCKERQEKLNALDRWARRVAGGMLQGAATYLRRLMEDEP